MQTAFEVGAIFKIVNQASPAIAKIMKEIRELSALVEKAKLNLASLGSGAASTAVGAATAQADKLAASWKAVGANAKQAQTAMAAAGRAGAASTGSANAAAAAGATVVPGGNRFRPGGGGRGGSGGVHATGPSYAVPGGHIGFRGPAMLGLGAMAYGVGQAMKYDDSAIMMASHAGVDWDENAPKFRKVLEDASIATAYNEHEVSQAAQTWLRMQQHTGGDNGVSMTGKALRLAAIEARRKGSSLPEAMESLSGLTHMLRKYSPEDFDKLAPAFVVLSTADPRHLKQIERAAGYAVPAMSAGLGLDPYGLLTMNTALARAGITNTKSGTWTREMLSRSIGVTGSSRHDRARREALQKFGLVDKKGNALWKNAQGVLDPSKYMDIVADSFSKLSPEDRVKYGHIALGRQGFGALSVLADPAVNDQYKRLSAAMNDPKSVNEARSFQRDYNEKSSLQGARVSLQTFNVTMADIGEKVLPVVNDGLKKFKELLDLIRSSLPEGKKGDGKGINWVGAGGSAGLGATAGGLLGMIPPIAPFVGGPVGGALIGGGVGGTIDVAKQYMDSRKEATFMDKLIAIEHEAKEAAKAARERRSGGGTVIPHITIQLDGKTLADVVGQNIGETHPIQAPSFDPMGAYNGGDSQ